MVLEHDYKNFPELSNTELEVLQFSSPHAQIIDDFEAVVVKVHDGDTVTLRTNFRDFDFPLRLLDVDAPELSEGGAVAQAWLENKVLGTRVFIEIDPYNRVGKYGRLLGKIIYNGMNVADEMQYLGLVSEFGKKKESYVEPLSKILREGDISA